MLHPDNLYLVQEMSDFNVRPNDTFSYRVYRELIQPSGLFSGAAAEQTLSHLSVIAFMAAGAPVRLVSTQIVSPNYFLELGVPAVLGRVLTAEDATAGKLAVVLSYQFWQSQFAGDRTVIGRGYGRGARRSLWWACCRGSSTVRISTALPTCGCRSPRRRQFMAMM